MWLVLEICGEPESCSASIPLPEGEFVVGRGRGCHLALPGRRISRRHLTFTRKGDEVAFAVFEEAIGTMMNGQEVERGSLVSGDRITIGRHCLRLEKSPPTKSPGNKEQKTLSVAIPSLTPPPVEDKDAWHGFQAFLETLRSSVDPRLLLKRLLLGLVQIFEAERGFVLLQQKKGERLVPVASHEIANVEEFAAISSTVYQKALRTNTTVYIRNSLLDDACAEALSLAKVAAPRTIVCGPLESQGQTYGVIYIDRPANGEELEASQLRLFETITGLTSQLLAASQTRNSLLAAKGRIEALNTLFWEQENFILGESDASRELKELITAAASQDVTVLITGETGTGKEMAARAIHRASARRASTFVPVNCAALPRNLIEAELFGAEKGAFTGAQERRIGRFELATSGTLFFDEVGELPLEMQVKLLRVLQEREVVRLGGTETISVDVRLICATNAKLEDAVREGAFRQDMYYRINVFRIHLKPLRERPEDIPALAKYFLDHFRTKFARKVAGFTTEAESIIRKYPWPGNIRELRNAVERAVVVEKGDLVHSESLPISAGVSRAPAGSHDDLGRAFWDKLPDDYETAREVFERSFLQRILQRYDHNVTSAAKAAGMPRSTVYRRMKKLGLLQD